MPTFCAWCYVVCSTLVMVSKQWVMSNMLSAVLTEACSPWPATAIVGNGHQLAIIMPDVTSQWALLWPVNARCPSQLQLASSCTVHWAGHCHTIVTCYVAQKSLQLFCREYKSLMQALSGSNDFSLSHYPHWQQPLGRVMSCVCGCVCLCVSLCSKTKPIWAIKYQNQSQ